VSAAIKQRHALSQTSKQLIAQAFSHGSLAYVLPHHKESLEIVTTATITEESNGTNLKPKSQTYF
jgi:hypothetical protein